MAGSFFGSEMTRSEADHSPSSGAEVNINGAITALPIMRFYWHTPGSFCFILFFNRVVLLWINSPVRLYSSTSSCLFSIALLTIWPKQRLSSRDTPKFYIRLANSRFCNRYRCMVRCTPSRFTAWQNVPSTNSIRVDCAPVPIRLLNTFPGTNTWFLNRPASSQVTILTEIPRLPSNINNLPVIISTRHKQNYV